MIAVPLSSFTCELMKAVAIFLRHAVAKLTTGRKRCNGTQQSLSAASSLGS
jgi:hypothetical protein